MTEERLSNIQTIVIPDTIALFAQSVVDYDYNCLYIIGIIDNPKILIFNLISRQYETNDSIIPNYDTIDVTPWLQCVIPLFDNNILQSIVSFGGSQYRSNCDHFRILERNNDNSAERFKWNTDPLFNQSMAYPNVGPQSKAVNINNNIHICGGGANENRYFVFNSNQKSLIEYPKINTIDTIENHGLIRYRNRLIVIGGMQNGEFSDCIHFIDLTESEMKGIISKPDIGDNIRWQTCKQTMPHKMRDFGCVSIEDTPISVIVGGETHRYKNLDSIYIFNAEMLSDDSNACFDPSKQKLPMPISGVNCTVTDGSDLHIIGGKLTCGRAVNTHYIIDLRNVIPSLETINKIVLYWIHSENMPIEIPSVLISLLAQFCSFVCN